MKVKKWLCIRVHVAERSGIACNLQTRIRVFEKVRSSEPAMARNQFANRLLTPDSNMGFQKVHFGIENTARRVAA